MAVQIKIRIIPPLTKKKNTKNRQPRKHLSVQKQNLRKSGEICPKLTIKIPERPHYYL